MKLSLRNLAMGTALAVSSLAFAQQMPFTVTEIFNRGVTAANFGKGIVLGETLRCATGYNGVVYALDKDNGTVYSVTGTEIKEFAKVDVNHGENNDHVMTAITTDDAGNIIVGYADGNAFYNPPKALAIIPAGGGEVIYTEPLTFPTDFTPGRTDVFGRIVGNVLSDEGAYFFVGGDKSGKTAACFYAANGEFTAEEYASNEYVNALTSSNVVVPPFSTLDEVAECDPLYNAGVMTPWNASGPEVIVEQIGKGVGRPEGLAYAAVPGADLFTYDGKTYYVVPYTRTAGKRTGDFVIYDEALNVLFKTENTATDDFISGGYLNGGGLCVHPVEGTTNKFILSFWGGPATQVMAASYEIEFPAAPTPQYPEQLYVVGAMADWTEPKAENAAAYENYILKATSDGVYNATVNVPLGKAQFRFFETLGGWDATQYGIAESDNPVDITLTDGAYNGTIVAGKGSINVPAWLGGTMDITVSLVDKTVSIKANEQFTPGDLYLRGDFNKWGTDSKLEGPVEKEGKYVYTATLATMPTGEFKVADNQWGADWGYDKEAPAFENGTACALMFKGKNLKFPATDRENISVEFVLNSDLSAELTFSWEEPKQPRNNYAYGIVLTDNGEGKYVIDFKATGDADATLIVTGDEGEQKFEIGAVKAGDNTYDFDASQLTEGKEYTFAIALNNGVYATAPSLVYTAPQFGAKTRGGMVVINDTESDAFGMAVACAGSAQGIQLIDQTLETATTYHAGYSAWNPDNQSSPFRGAEREGLAVFGDYSDAGANYYVFDPLNPTELKTMLGEPAVMDATGLWTLNGVEIAGGNSGLAFVGKGENTRMYTFIKDNTEHPKTLAYYNIGTATMITEAPAAWLTDASKMLPNNNVEIAPAANGMYIAQTRSNADESSVCRMLYMDFEGEVKANWWNDEVVTCAGGVAITADEKTLAVATQSEILFFEITMDEATNTPELKAIADWTIPMASSFSELRFDIAGNLYVYCRDNKGVQVYACPFGQDAVTAAKAQYVIKGIGSGVEGVAVDAADAEAVYYTVGGVRVAAEDLTPGVYVKVVGNTATKVIVK